MIVAIVAIGLSLGSREQPVQATDPISSRLLKGNISDLDYPPALKPLRIETTSEVAILIDPKGKVAECRPTVVDRYANLHHYTCSLVKERFRYRPYKLQGGQNAWVSDIVRVFWRLPKE